MADIFRFADRVPIPPTTAKKSRTSTKLYFQNIGTPNGAIHNRASFGGETTALEDTGTSTWNIAYVDAEKAEVIFEVGAGGYENQTVLFTQHIMNHGAKLIVADPRKTMRVRNYDKTVF